jgi:hypothetical protein
MTTEYARVVDAALSPDEILPPNLMILMMAVATAPQQPVGGNERRSGMC